MPGIIVVIVIGIMVMNHYGITMIATMITWVVIIVVMTINTHGHYRKSSKIGRINRIMIGRIIGHVHG